MSFQKSKPVHRSSLLTSGYIVAFSLLLMAFEYSLVHTEKKEVPEMSRLKVVPEALPQPTKPEPKQKEPRSSSEKVDPSLTPELRKEPEDRRKDPDPVDLEEELKIDGREDPESSTRMKIPDYKPEKPVPEHKLDRRAILPACQDREDRKAQEECTDERLPALLRKYTEYPEALREMGVEGEVTVVFVVDRTGKVDEVQVLQSSNREMERAVEEAVKQLPNFIPARMKGYKVPMRHSAPVTFNLR
jgi:protein TonB